MFPGTALVFCVTPVSSVTPGCASGVLFEALAPAFRLYKRLYSKIRNYALHNMHNSASTLVREDVMITRLGAKHCKDCESALTLLKEKLYLKKGFIVES